MLNKKEPSSDAKMILRDMMMIIQRDLFALKENCIVVLVCDLKRSEFRILAHLITSIHQPTTQTCLGENEI